ncbi:MAG: carboxypeptidase regulatory-like domain-containing protein [Opitutaceae bacterium]|jgi:hypothetical protein|nr:carboxypeptidase regulatory-like domain-containing protein [Opitutaceae bacterium]
MPSTITHLSRLLLSATVAALGLAVPAQAQAINTAPLSGIVRAEDGRPVGGARVKITHEPTATVTHAVSAPDGSYASRGLRPGGPYTVLAEASGYHAVELKGVHLAVESGASVTVAMRPSDIVYLETFSVVADAASPLFDPAATDKGTYLSRRDIENTITGDRSINSLAASDPRIIYNRDPSAKSISVNALNNRYNSIMVDGVSASDPFGLNGNNTAAERNPIPVEAIEAVAISASPYDVRKGNAIGAFLNSITKSGGNAIHGSLYYTFRNRDLVGERIDGEKKPLTTFKEQTFGASLGGPLIPRKLFFFASYEKVDADRDASNPGAWAAPDTIRQIKEAAENLGFNPGDARSPGKTIKDKDSNLFFKIDWQINAGHRLSATYRGSDSSQPRFPGFGSGSGVNNFSFSNTWYELTKKNDSLAAQLVSRWTDKWNTEIAVSRSHYAQKPDLRARQPWLQIRDVPVPGSSNTAYVTLGVDYSYHANELEVESTTAEVYNSYQLGATHTLHAGVQFETSDVYNVYMQHAYGSYEFANLEQFLSIAAPGSGVNDGSINYYRYRYRAAFPGVNPAAEFTEGKLGVFVRDVWRIHPRFQVDMGLRLDTALIGDDVPFNQAFYNTFHARNDSTYDGKTLVQPRAGFNWRPKINDGRLRTLVRGGAGLFHGGMPRVWLSNSYGNTGMNYTNYEAGTNVSGSPPAPKISADPYNQLAGQGSLPSVQSVAFMNPGFRLPSQWKGNIAIEREIGLWDIKATIEWEKSWVKDDVHFRNINLRQTATASDGRALYAGTYNGGVPGGGTARVSSAFDTRIAELTNTGKGESGTFIFMLERPRKKDGWSWTASYTYTDRKEVVQGNASTPGSLWGNKVVFNPNDEELHRGDLEIRHSVKVRIEKELDLLPVGRTTVTLRYEGRGGLPFSIVARNDVNMDGVSQNDLVYIPYRNGDPKAVFDNQATKDTFYRIVDRYGLKEGTVVQANSATYPSVHLFDLGLYQDVKLPGWRHKLKLGIDILNVGNLLNDKWGVIHGSSQFFTKKQAAANIVYNRDTGQYTYSNANTDLARGAFPPELSSYVGEPAATRWSILFSVRYEF